MANQEEKHEGQGHDKTTTIYVNGREEQVTGKMITFQRVIEIAFGNYEENENIVYTVSYSKGNDPDEGTMVKGDEVKVKKDMIFNATRTDKS
ncbi:MAG: multiubiquitin domain-containing protein [bacterium]|nr:multiubiquitin domain-containing protein [bacterium]